MGDKVVKLAGEPTRYYLAMIDGFPETCRSQRFAARLKAAEADTVLRHLQAIDVEAFAGATVEEFNPPKQRR